ncbi:hypothetical protein BBP29_16935 [Alteromonas macleodii]|jgi:hypothetical protein|nr:hypothetical protein BBP29_16935 [Alteromonas macleodii]
MNINRTKADSTIQDYQSRVATLTKRCGLEINDENYYKKLVEQLLSEKSQISTSTWRKKKAALVWYLEKNNVQHLADSLLAISSEGAIKKPNKTSACKKKHLTKKEEDTIRQELETLHDVGDFWGLQLLPITELILTTGLRPIEMKAAKLYINQQELHSEIQEHLGHYSGSYPVLKIRNAKNTNGRSFGEFRFVDLSEVSQRSILAIRLALLHVNKARTTENDSVSFEDYYEVLRKAFSRLVNRLFSDKRKKISLYTYRHQCIANLKSAKTPLSHIAAIVGHGNDLTASEHYGKGRFGRGDAGLVKANTIDVGKVKLLFDKKVNKNFQPTQN